MIVNSQLVSASCQEGHLQIRGGILMSYWTIKLAFHILRRRLTYTSVMYHSHQLNTQHVIVIFFPGKTPSLLTIKVGIEQLKINDEKRTFLCWL